MTPTSVPIRVLHVDDRREILDLTKAFLTDHASAFVVHSVLDAETALETLADPGIDCVVSDYEMAGTDGLELLATMRERGFEQPFILFTGRGSEELASEAISAGVSDYVQKGVDPGRFEMLAHSIVNAVDRDRNERLLGQVYDAMHLVDEGVGLVDENGRFRYVNESYAETFGYAPGELIDEHWSVLYRTEADAEYVGDVVRVDLSDGVEWHGKTLHEREDGSLFYADHHLGVSDEGVVVCRVKDTVDVTHVPPNAPPIEPETPRP